MLEHGLHPFQDELYADGTRPSPWARGRWAPFLWDNDEIERAVRYVNNNPTRDGMKKQSWTFVTPFVRRD